jgi:hypothetical protein
MPKQCPECSTILRKNAGRCDACGCDLSRAGAHKTWEKRMLPYAAIAVILVLIGFLIVYLRG